MATATIAFADNRNTVHPTARAATESDLAALLGKIGDGESLAPGIAKLLFDKRTDLEIIFALHDQAEANGARMIGAGAA